MMPETHVLLGETIDEPYRIIVVANGVVTASSDFADYAVALNVATTVGASLNDSATIHVIPAHTCPRCSCGIPNDANRGRYIGALSRRHRFVEICSDCGTAEALDDYFEADQFEFAWWITNPNPDVWGQS